MIDPALQAFVEDSDRFYPPDTAERTVAEQRVLYDAYSAAFAVRRPPGIRSRDAMRDLPGRSVGLRLYEPENPTAGLILYAHGGGFVLGSLDSHDSIVARVSEAVGCAVVAIDYRLAPEHPCPAAHDDIFDVAEAALAGRLPWPDQPTAPLALMGDSAGATLVAAAALRLNRKWPDAVAALALVYPALGFEPAEPARTTEREAPMLTLADLRFYRDAYLAGRQPPPGCFLLDEADLSVLPPTVLLPAEHDPLRDDCTVLAARLRAHGTDVQLLPGTGLVHGCLRALDRADAVARPFADMLAFVRAGLRP